VLIDTEVFSTIYQKKQKKSQKTCYCFSKHETQKNVMNVSRMWKKRRLKDYLQNLKTEFVFFFLPRRPNERKTREKPKKKDLSEFLECLTKFCRITFFLFPPF